MSDGTTTYIFPVCAVRLVVHYLECCVTGEPAIRRSRMEMTEELMKTVARVCQHVQQLLLKKGENQRNWIVLCFTSIGFIV